MIDESDLPPDSGDIKREVQKLRKIQAEVQEMALRTITNVGALAGS